MKKNYFLFFLLLFFYSNFQLFAQENKVFCQRIEATRALINTSHYEPKPVNKELSKAVFKLFCKNLDPDGSFFTQEDFLKFQEDQTKLNDYILSGDCSFIEKYSATLKKRIEQVEGILKDFKTEDLQYNKNQKFLLLAERTPFSLKNDEDLADYWNKKIRLEILTEIVEQDSILSSVQENFTNLEKKLKPKIIEKELCQLNEFLAKEGGISKFTTHAFLNAFVKYQDPNSTFFNDAERVGFESAIASNQESFGFSTDKNDEGEIVVRYITPGSPAFKHADFEVDDIIKKLESNGDVLKTFCVSNDDIQNFTRGKNHKTITFTLKKKSGRIQKVKLTRTLQKVQENSITGFLLEKDQKIGYVKLPSFYTDLESPNGLGVANDVAKQLYKLQQENIEGLIIDLRFNGGGAMKEASDLSGMFINKGPLSILKYNTGETFTIKDANRGSLFNKPILILINHFSASASEFFAGAMQDYNRAILVGTTTHGKASAQVILPLNEVNQKLGFVKLTVEKFYRPTGKSHQGMGVTPDIILPSLYDNLKTAEKYQDYALIADEVEVSLAPRPLKKLPLAALNTKSKQRLTNNYGFTIIKATNKKLVKSYFESTEETLTPTSSFNGFESYKTMWKPYGDFIKNYKNSVKVKNTTSTKEVLAYNPDAKEINEQSLEEINKDLYIEEAYSILTDYINLKKSY
ncbi:S41 family peptidase [Mesonia aquimarina]|uniref:S41 family peptidase n=1 Tax=Mesonia aquimarina TaxID=1504967 RepID=UPI000EF5FF84|nr:S41 family peptidase [Mesonia aquimarina]